jgi:hypothetical protein
VFESGSPERYLALYPFVCLAMAYGFSQLSTRTAAPVAILAFAVLAIAVNGASLSKPRIMGELAPAALRMDSLRGKVSSEGLVALVTLQDTVYLLATTHPFHPANRGGMLPVYDVIEVANERIAKWQANFAKRALDSLRRPQSVWISKRLLAERPEPAWNWTEGDDPRISWKQLPPFFLQFSYSQDVGGADGFLKMEPSPQNMLKLEAIAGR